MAAPLANAPTLLRSPGAPSPMPASTRPGPSLAGRSAADESLRELLLDDSRLGGEAAAGEADGPEVPATPPLPAELEHLGELGQGGMGVVHLARQRSLSREVAVKSVNPAAPRKTARRGLLMEALATAALEHPNIVPVYTLSTDAAGEPHVVMRRIQGRTWTELILDPEAVEQGFGARDTLGWHLRVLMVVCSAIHYAHSRGILHRDLKPDNVMVGSFGEVYVLDWGLAARLGDGGLSALPLLRDDRRIVGTPRFMAPEQAIGDGRLQGAHTDVYLLGALLYGVLTGQGPHPGEGIEETLAAIPGFEPVMPEGTPPRLVGVVSRAMAKEPADRFPSAEALRLALQSFLEERSADSLAADAAQQLEQLERRLGEPEPDRQAVYRHFGACRFGFQQALHAFEGHDAAGRALQQALTQMAEYEQSQGNGRAAAVHIAELVAPPAGLLAAQARVLAAEAEAERLRADRDPTLGQRTRIFVFGLVTALWTLLPLLTWLLDVSLSWERTFGSHGLMFLFSLGLVIWARESLGRSVINRRVVSIILAAQGSMLLGFVASWLAGAAPGEVLRTNTLIFAMMSLTAIESLSWYALFPATAYFGSLFASSVQPALLLPSLSLANAVVFATIFAKWFPDARGRLLFRTEGELALLRAKREREMAEKKKK